MVPGTSETKKENHAMRDVQLSSPITLSSEERARLKQLIATDAAARSAFAPIKAQADAALGDKPDPVTRIIYEGRIEADPERVRTKESLQDMEKLRMLDYAYAATGETKYRDKAKEIILAWSSTTQVSGNPINENKLDAIFVAYPAMKEAFSAAERQQIVSWMRRIGEAEMAGGKAEKGNWKSKRIKIVGLIGFALNDQKMIDYTVKEYKEYMAGNLYPDGRSFDLEERDALSYHVGGLKPLMEIALAARAGGHDLYRLATPEGASVRKSVDLMVPYARGEKVYPQWVNSRVKFDRERWEAGDEHYKPGSPYDPKDSLELFELAALFDTDLRPIVLKLSDAKPSEKYPSWLSVLSAVVRTSDA